MRDFDIGLHCFDLSDKQGLQNLIEMVQEESLRVHMQIKCASFLIGCKCDLPQAVPDAEIKQAMELYPNTFREYLPISSLTMQNVDKLRDTLIKRIERAYYAKFPKKQEQQATCNVM